MLSAELERQQRSSDRRLNIRFSKSKNNCCGAGRDSRNWLYSILGVAASHFQVIKAFPLLLTDRSPEVQYQRTPLHKELTEVPGNLSKKVSEKNPYKRA